MESALPLAAGIPVHCAHHAIRRHGWRVAIRVSRRSGFIVSGTGAAAAARRIPTDTAPVEYHDYDSEHEELAHNRLAELSVTDADLLKAALTELGGAGCDLPTCFTPAARRRRQLRRRVKARPRSARGRFREGAMDDFRKKVWSKGRA